MPWTGTDIKHRGARLYRSLLLPKSKRRGRPRNPDVTKAIRLLKQLKAKFPGDPMPEIWARIYPKVIPGYSTMDKQQKEESQKWIRDRARKGRKSQRTR